MHLALKPYLLAMWQFFAAQTGCAIDSAFQKSVNQGIRMQNKARHSEERQCQPDRVMHTPEKPLDPGTIRETVSVLIAQGELDMAIEMTDLARVIHPNNESVLVMSALVAEVSQDWFKAHTLLTRLHYLQGESITAETYRHEIRVLRCLGSNEQAMNLVKAALIKFPTDGVLLEEHAGLLRLSNKSLSTID
jgi:hypothetical protein